MLLKGLAGFMPSGFQARSNNPLHRPLDQRPHRLLQANVNPGLNHTLAQHFSPQRIVLAKLVTLLQSAHALAQITPLVSGMSAGSSGQPRGHDTAFDHAIIDQFQPTGHSGMTHEAIVDTPFLGIVLTLNLKPLLPHRLQPRIPQALESPGGLDVERHLGQGEPLAATQRLIELRSNNMTQTVHGFQDNTPELFAYLTRQLNISRTGRRTSDHDWICD